MMELKLNLDDELATRLKAAAHQRHQSVEEAAIDILNQSDITGNLEQRQFIGRVISGEEILKHDHLVMISGIYYRYQIMGDQPVDKHLNYEIINSEGNLIFLKPKGA